MAVDTELEIRIKAKLDSGVKRALAGITSDVKKAEAEKANAATKSAADITKAAERSAKEREALNVRSVSNFRRAEIAKKLEAFTRAREILDDFKKTEQKKREELAKTLRETTLSEGRRAQLIARTERDIRRERGRSRADAREALSGGAGAARGARRRQLMGAAGGAVMGAAAGAFSVAQRAQGALGMKSQEELIAAAVDQRQDFIRTASMGGRSQQQQDDVLSEVVRVSRGTGVGTGELLGGINQSQELYSNLDRLMPNLEFLAKAARATGSEFSTVVRAAGEMERQFQLSGEDVQEAIAILSRGAEEGSLSFADFADSQAQGFAGFNTARGTSGIDSLRELQAIAQALRAGGLGASEVRTRQQALLNNLSDGNVQGRLREAGVEVLDDAGNIRNIGEIVNQVMSSRALQTSDGGLSSTALRGAFGDQEAAQAIAILASQERASAAGTDGALSLAQREQVSSEAGRATIDRTFDRLNADASGRAVNMRVGREASVMENSASLIDAFAQVAGPLTDLQDEFPLLTQALTALTSVVGGAGVGGAGGGLLSGLTTGGAAAGGTAAAGAYGGVGTLAAAGGAAALAVPAGLLALGLGGMAIDSPEGSDMFDFWGEQFGGAPANQDAMLRANAVYTEKSGGGAPVDEANTRATEENNRIIREQTQALRENTAATRENSRSPDGGADPVLP